MKKYIRSKIHKKNLKVTLKLVGKLGKVKRYRSGSIKRFTNRIQGYQGARIDIRVEYGKDKDINGKYVMFYNEGSYDCSEKKEAIKAIRAFIE